MQLTVVPWLTILETWTSHDSGSGGPTYEVRWRWVALWREAVGYYQTLYTMCRYGQDLSIAPTHVGGDVIRDVIG